MIINPFFFGSPDTNGNGQQVIGVFGDSLTTKRNPTGSTYGPTPTAGTVYQYKESDQTIVEIGATDIIQAGSGANWGSIWPQAGISYYNATGYKPIFATLGVGGTNYAPRTGETDNWSASSTLYATQKAKLDTCLTVAGVTKPKYIIIILGINDARGSTALATIQTEINAFYVKIQNDYPGVQILIYQIGRDENGVQPNRVINVRKYIRDVAQNNTNVHIIGSLGHFFENGYYDSDGIHLLQTGNNKAGEMFGRWAANPSYSKWARSIIASHLTDPSTTQKNRIAAGITAMGNSYFECEFIYIQKTTSPESDTYLDYCFLLSGSDESSVFTSDVGITTNGSSTYWEWLTNTSNWVKATTSDFFFGVKIATNRSVGGATRNAFGTGSATAQLVVGQTSAPVPYYRALDLTTTTYPSQTVLPNNTFIAVARNSGTKILINNSTEVHSASVALVGGTTNLMRQGVLNANGTNSGFIDADFEYACGGKYSTISRTEVYNGLEAFAGN